MFETMPFSLAVLASSDEDQRESGLPDSLGKVQASAVICALCIEGKKTRGSRARFLLKGRAVTAGCPAAAHRDHGTSGLFSDGGIVPIGMLIGQNQNFRAHDLGMRRFAQPRDMLKICVFFGCQADRNFGLGSSGHKITSPSYNLAEPNITLEKS